MSGSDPQRVLVLGGGFAGVYAALELEKALRRRRDLAVTLVNRENYFLFTPMLHEVAASDLDLTHIVNPVRKLLRRVQFVNGGVRRIDLRRRLVTVEHGGDGHLHDLPFDQLVLALGSVTNFFGLPGLERHALTMKTLDDAVRLRNRILENLEEADTECCGTQRRALGTCVVAGGGFAGVETIAGIHDFAHEALRWYRNLRAADLRMVLVHAGDVLLPELGPELGAYAQAKLAARGVEIRVGTRVVGVEEGAVVLGDGTRIPTRALVWAAGTSPHPLLATLGCATERGRLRVDEYLRVTGAPGVWAAGDCAAIPGPRGGTHPPTAQHAVREGKTLARNLLAAIDGAPPRPFRFRTLGQLAAIGRRTGVARMFGVQFSGFFAWWMWRTIYLAKLPRFEKKLRVALDWTLDLVFSKDLVQFSSARDAARLPAARAAPAPEASPAPHAGVG